MSLKLLPRMLAIEAHCCGCGSCMSLKLLLRMLAIEAQDCLARF
jgi:hypothetical protein